MNQDQQAPVAQQPPQMAQPAAPDTNTFAEQPKVQYVVMQKSLEGIGGWLAFFLVVFGMDAVYYIMHTFADPAGIHTVTDPLIGLAFVACTVLVSMRKKVALWAVYGTLVLSFLISVINILTGDTDEVGVMIGSIVGSLVFHGLVALYFFSSKRVKATLTR